MSDGTTEDEGLRFTLYVGGRTSRADRVVQDLEDMVADRLGVPVHVDVIDVLERPDLAVDDLIMATPTLVRDLPRPARRLIGDLTDMERVLTALGVLGPHPSDPPSATEA